MRRLRLATSSMKHENFSTRTGSPLGAERDRRLLRTSHGATLLGLAPSLPGAVSQS